MEGEGGEERREREEKGKGKGRAGEGKAREVRGRTTLHTPCRKFLATPLGGKTFPPGPTWRQFVSIPPSVEGPVQVSAP